MTLKSTSNFFIANIKHDFQAALIFIYTSDLQFVNVSLQYTAVDIEIYV